MTKQRIKPKEKRYLRNRLLQRERALLGIAALATGLALALLFEISMAFLPGTPLAQYLTSGTKTPFIFTSALISFGLGVIPWAHYRRLQQQKRAPARRTAIAFGVGSIIMLLFLLTLTLQTFLPGTPLASQEKPPLITIFLRSFFILLGAFGMQEFIASIHPKIRKRPDGKVAS